MQKIIYTLFVAIFTISSVTALELTIAGKSNAVIITNKNSSTDIVTNAVKDFQKTLQDITGANIAINEQQNDKKVEIYIGKYFAKDKFHDDLDFLKGSDGFAIRNQGDNIYIFGANPEGTRNGIYSFLENNSDIIWARPLPFGTIYSKMPTFTVIKANYRSKPVTIWRGWQITSVGRNDKRTTSEWLVRNGCNWDDYGPKKSIGGGHNIKRLLKEYMVDGNPFVGMHNGKRVVKGAPQVCFSNHKLWEVFTNKFLAYIKANPKANLFEINIDDTNRTCECANCAKPINLPDGSILKPGDPAFRSTQFFIFLNYVAKKVKKIYPNIKIKSYAYIFTIIPPKIKLEDNISIEIAPLTRDYKGALTDKVNRKQYGYIKRYSQICSDIVIYEYYGWSEFPRPIADVVAKDLKFFNSLGIKKIHSELNADVDKGPWSNKKYMLSQVWDAGAMEYWVICKLYWNPFQDVNKLRQIYLKRAFRKAAPAMEKYYDLIRKSWNSTKGKTNYRGYSVSLTAKYIIKNGIEKQCRKALLEATKKAENPKVKKMVKRVSNLFEKYIAKAKKTLPPEVDVPYIKNAKNFDFNFNSEIWQKACEIRNFCPIGTTENSADTTVYLMCDNENLYIAYDCQEVDLNGLTSNSNLKDKESWLFGEAVETFISDDKGSYFQLNVNPMGQQYDAHGFNKKWHGAWRVKVKRGTKCWQAVLVIPFETVNIPSNKNSRIKAMFCHQMLKDGKEIKVSWSGKQLHRPNEFGTINIEIGE